MAVSRSVPSTSLTRAVRSETRMASIGAGYASSVPAAAWLEATSANSSQARSAAMAVPFGSTPRSKRADDSVRRPRCFEVRRIPSGVK